MCEILKNNDRVLIVRDGDYVSKKFKNLNSEENKILMSKLDIKDKFSGIEGIVLPINYTVSDGYVDEIYTPYIDLPDFYVSLTHEIYDMETIAYVMEDVQRIINEGHKKGLVFTDFISQGNLKYDPKTRKAYILDYTDNQIDNFKAVHASITSRPFKSKKYFNRGLYTKDFDQLLILIRWFSLCTGLDFTKVGVPNPNNGLKMANLDDRQMISSFNKLLMDTYPNDDLTGEFYRMYEDYDLKSIIPEIPKLRIFKQKDQ